MSTETTDAPAKTRAWVWQVLGLILAFYILEQDVEYALLDMNLIPQSGALNATMRSAPDFGSGQVIVKAIEPGSPLPAAGVAVGDHIRFDRLIDFGRIYRVGEPIGFTLNHQGRLSHQVVQAVPYAETDARKVVYDFGFNLADIISLLIGAFIIWRSRGKLATMALGGALISFGLTEYWPQFLESNPHVFAGFSALNYASSVFEALLFATFAALFYRDNSGSIRPWVWWSLAAYGVIHLIINELSGYCDVTATRLPVIGNGVAISGWLDYVGFAVTFGFLVAGWRRSSRDIRRRYTLLLMAISAVIVAQILQIALSSLLPVADYRETPWIVGYDILGGVIAPLLFAYTILRHKVFDLGFAVNRTLVYGAVSIVLLVGFGLIEWASEKFIPIESREKNLFIDAAIALGIFLVFHRVRDFAETVIEDIFFRGWRDKEKELRKFVGEAAFIMQRPALMKALVKALTRFSGGSEVALYLPEGGADRGNGYVQAEGRFTAFGKHLDGDDETLVSLRAGRQPLETRDGTLVLPMIHRNELSGMVVLGHKPGGDAWRPDESEVLAWAVLQIGQDLHALKVEQLEADAAALRQKNAILSAQVEMAKAR
ncbi:MAG: hypothetical protein ACXU8U_06825 [Asticcacaulis sp.]